MLSHVLTNESSSRIFSYINLNGFLSPLSRKNLFKLQDKIVVSSMEKYPTAPSEKSAQAWKTVGRRVALTPFRSERTYHSNKNELVTHTKVTRKVNKRIVTQSKNIIVPLPPSAPSERPDPSSPTRSTSPTPTKPAHKGPSRSTAVTIAPSILR